MITGDIFDGRTVLRSLDFAGQTMVLEDLTKPPYEFAFRRVSFYHTLPIDKTYAHEVYSAKLADAQKRSEHKGKYKVSKTLVAKLRAQLEAI